MSALMEKFKDYPLVVLSGVVILVCLVLYFIRGDMATTLEQTEGELYGQIRVIEKNKISANGLDAELEQLEAYVKSIDEGDRLFNPNQSAFNANFFYELEDEVDIVITRVDQVLARSDELELKEYSTITYSLSVEGTLSNLIRLMYTLHVAQPLMRVADFRVSDNARSLIPNSLGAELRVLVLAQKE